MTEDEKIWKAVTDTVIPLGSPGAKRKRSRAIPVRDPDTLDLHGLTVQQAYEVTREFVGETRYRKVLIITGRSGQIRAEFERWLDTLPRVRQCIVVNNGSYELVLQ